MLFAKQGCLLESINEFKINGIINAANGIGIMGAGIAGAIKNAGGKQIQDNARKVCAQFKPKVGDAYMTTSGTLIKQGVKCIIHAVVMGQPGSLTSYEIVKHAFISAIEQAIICKISVLGTTALGTGVGSLNCKKVAAIMYNVAQNYNNIDIVFVDFKSEFISIIQQLDKCK